MILISHRGNINGKLPEKENHPDYILTAIQAGYEVEIDVWFENGKFMLGHDKPQYDFPFELMQNYYSKLWLHCKNLEALEIFLKLDATGSKLNYFWHESDRVALTSKNIMWAHPGTQPLKGSIAVLPEWEEDDTSQCAGICSDYIEKYK
jgi:hypothetical protein